MAEGEAQAQSSSSSSAPPPPPPSSIPPPQSANPPQGMGASGIHDSQGLALQLSSSNGEEENHGQGLYAVQFSPFMGMMPEYPPSVLIPLKYKIPTRTNPAGAAGEEQGQGGEAARQQQGPQRQIVVRRFQLVFQLDLALLLKLAFAVVLFSQEGSRQRTIVLVLLASLVYLYQTGALTPLIHYARRGLAPHRPAPRPENAPARPPNDAAAAENAGNENQNPAAEANLPPGPEQARHTLWGIMKEVQTFIVEFIASLLPGFEQHND